MSVQTAREEPPAGAASPDLPEVPTGGCLRCAADQVCPSPPASPAPEPGLCGHRTGRWERPPRQTVAVATVALVGAVGACLGLAQWQARGENSPSDHARARESMVRVARAAAVPPAFVASPRGCPSHGAEVVLCGHVPGEVQGVARYAQTALTRAAHRPAQLKCTPEPSRAPGIGNIVQECTVHISDGEHGVIVFVSTDVDRDARRPGLRGSALTVQAF